MSLLALPPEIKSLIYQYVFLELVINFVDGDHEHDEAAPYIVYRPNDTSIDAIRPFNVAVFGVSQSFRRDENILRAMFQNCTLRLDSAHQLSAFEGFLKHSPIITMFGAQLPFQHLQTRLHVLHNLERSKTIRNGRLLREIKSLTVILDGPSNPSSYKYVAIFPYADNVIIPCTSCEPPVKPCPQGHAEGDYRCCTTGRSFCDEHMRANPRIFALPKASARRSFTTTDGKYTSNFYHTPEKFILMNFFNDLTPSPGIRHGDGWCSSCILASNTKLAIMQEKMNIRVLCRIVFVEETEYIVDAEFDTRDWILSYIWEGDRYEIPQKRPTLYNKNRDSDHKMRKVFVASTDSSLPE